MKTALCFLVAAALCAGGLVFTTRLAPAPDPAEAVTPAPALAPAFPPAELAALARDVYQVTECRFVQPDLVWVTPPPGADPQSLCQALANVWAARSGLPWVRVESWQDGRRLAQATVRH